MMGWPPNWVGVSGGVEPPSQAAAAAQFDSGGTLQHGSWRETFTGAGDDALNVERAVSIDRVE
ncbi:MAG: hypothetical protein ACLPYS_09640 [Vulcanimicrobiaceae bacterium]